MSRSSAATDELVIGGQPRVDLLPPEVKAGQRAKGVRRRLIVTLVAVAVLMGAGVAGASWEAAQSQGKLAAAQDRTTSLLTEQAKYAVVVKVQNEVDTALGARQFGASTEVDWKGYLGKVKAVLPANVTIDTVAVDSASPLVVFEQATAPLQSARIATLKISLTSPTLPTVPKWLEALKSLPGYADATPGLIKRSGEGAGAVYEVELTLHINQDAYSNRFASTEGK
jgi:hypothetical protein